MFDVIRYFCNFVQICLFGPVPSLLPHLISIHFLSFQGSFGKSAVAGFVSFSRKPKLYILSTLNIELLLWQTKLIYIPSTLNIELILWHTQLIVCVQKMLNHGLNHGFFLSLSSLYPATYIELYMC